MNRPDLSELILWLCGITASLLFSWLPVFDMTDSYTADMPLGNRVQLFFTGHTSYVSRFGAVGVGPVKWMPFDGVQLVWFFVAWSIFLVLVTCLIFRFRMLNEKSGLELSSADGVRSDQSSSSLLSGLAAPLAPLKTISWV